MAATATTGQSPWSRELNAFTRAFSGAFVFGIPLLFTMEMWWIGEYATRWKLLAFLALGFGANLGLNWVSGFRRERADLFVALEEAVEATAVGLVAATGMLLVLNRINLSDTLNSALGMILIQAVPLSIGASVANEVFGRPGDRRDPDGEHSVKKLPQWQELASDIGATIIGGIFLGFSIAPTEEIPMLASGLDLVHILALVAFTFLVSYMIVFASGFDRSRPEGPFQHPITETTLAFVISFVVSLVALFLFDQITFDQPMLSIIKQTLVLCVPTTVGGAAGRLVV